MSIDEVQIENTRIIIATEEKGQTVNVCSAGVRGNYGAVYRCSERKCWVTTIMLQAHVLKLADLKPFLSKRGFEDEGPRGHS
jgi:hypothetical protein